MKVAILVFPGVEELDFVGFLEVLAVANRVVGRRYFQTRLVGINKGVVRCSGGLRVVPDGNLSSLGGTDLVFVPGGGASKRTGVESLRRNRRVLAAIRKAHEDGKKVWSVCTGALVLSKAGILKGRRAVTHHEYLEVLEKEGVEVVRDRVVSDGNIVTGGGISSSIDVGLHLVNVALGARVEEEVRERMEYRSPEAA